jgi:hypothetical protein
MAICNAKHCPLQPKFPNNKIDESKFIRRANVADVVFKPLDNCPHIEQMRSEGLLPWASSTINFFKE